MMYQYLPKIILISFFLLMSACTSVPEEPEYNAYQIGKEALEAYNKKDWKQAEEKFSLLISISPGTVENWFKLGNIYARTKRTDKAIAAYKEAVIRRPGYEKAWRNLGIVSLRKTTHLYIEMLQHLNTDSLSYIRAKKTSEVLLKLIKKNQAKIKSPSGTLAK